MPHGGVAFRQPDVSWLGASGTARRPSTAYRHESAIGVDGLRKEGHRLWTETTSMVGYCVGPTQMGPKHPLHRVPRFNTRHPTIRRDSVLQGASFALEKSKGRRCRRQMPRSSRRQLRPHRPRVPRETTISVGSDQATNRCVGAYPGSRRTPATTRTSHSRCAAPMIDARIPRIRLSALVQAGW